MLEELKRKVCTANLDLVKHGVVLFTWGNVSARDPETGLVVIKPSGVAYEVMQPDDMVVVDMDGNIVEGRLRPSTDLPTHLELYKADARIGGVVHTHSTYASAWAQAGRAIPFYGTTHADYFHGEIPCTRSLTAEEVAEAYEKNTGTVIRETFTEGGYDWIGTPGVLVRNHGVFSWGKDAAEAVYHAVVMEAVAKMAVETERINPAVTPAPDYLLEKHYQRKHGKNAYYGQK
ncbi:MAG: L-ribulose-5-phosphate 4-epimerase [Clostridia bacterium]|nr:L-ribulose-5-phosphate 4-epimerase [Clostridia bacterium]